MGRRTDGRVERFFRCSMDRWIDRRGRARESASRRRRSAWEPRSFVSFVRVVRAWERCARDGCWERPHRDASPRDERDGDGGGDERGDGSKAVDVVREGDARGGVVDGERDDAGARRRGVGRRVRVGPGDVRRVRTRARCELGDGARGDGVRADDRVDASRARVDEVRVARARDGGRVRGAGGDGRRRRAAGERTRGR